jgi:hypothetical protein
MADIFARPADRSETPASREFWRTRGELRRTRTQVW